MTKYFTEEKLTTSKEMVIWRFIFTILTIMATGITIIFHKKIFEQIANCFTNDKVLIGLCLGWFVSTGYILYKNREDYKNKNTAILDKKKSISSLLFSYMVNYPLILICVYFTIQYLLSAIPFFVFTDNSKFVIAFFSGIALDFIWNYKQTLFVGLLSKLFSST